MNDLFFMKYDFRSVKILKLENILKRKMLGVFFISSFDVLSVLRKT
jgi:hypothetical protein